MIRLSFKKSSSPEFKTALKIVQAFSHESHSSIIINCPVKDIFEKWDHFCRLFELIIEWEDTSFSYDEETFTEHEDKVKIFNALKRAHNQWIITTKDTLPQLHKNYPDEHQTEHIIHS